MQRIRIFTKKLHEASSIKASVTTKKKESVANNPCRRRQQLYYEYITKMWACIIGRAKKERKKNGMWSTNITLELPHIVKLRCINFIIYFIARTPGSCDDQCESYGSGIKVYLIICNCIPQTDICIGERIKRHREQVSDCIIIVRKVDIII